MKGNPLLIGSDTKEMLVGYCDRCPVLPLADTAFTFPIGVLPTSSAMLSYIARAVDISFAQHSGTNGSTVSLIHGSMVGKKLFSASIYPSRSITLWKRPSWEVLFDYIKANLDLLLRPGHALGTWFNDYECIHCLDLVVLVRNRDAAMEMGRHSDQLAIFDLEGSREISIQCPTRESTA